MFNARQCRVLLVLILGFWCTISFANPPEIMIVLDASSSMQFVPNADRLPSGCDFPRGGAPNGLISAEDPDPETQTSERMTRFHLVQNVLSAYVANSGCIGHSAQERHNDHIMGGDLDFPHFRRMCKNANSQDIPCGKDHGRSRATLDPDLGSGGLPVNQSNVGFLTDDTGTTFTDIAFGLMVSDSNPIKATSQRTTRKDWSFGDEALQSPVLPPVDLPPGQQDRTVLNFGASYISLVEGFNSGLSSVARAPLLTANPDLSYLENYPGQVINLGVMDTDAPSGRMILPHQGTLDEPTLLLNNDPQKIQQHNDWIRDEVQRIVPTGPTPLSAMLDDLRRYYEDAEYDGCATRVAVLITDGAESSYLPVHRCQNHNDCQLGDLVGKCIQTRHASLIHHERMSVNSGSCAHQTCSKVCAFSNGAPYPSVIENARKLHDELGIPLIVATVGLPDAIDYLTRLDDMPPALMHAYQIAEAGSPNLGPREGMPGIYTISELRSTLKGDDLIQRLQGQSNGGVKVETQPLIMSSTPSDALWLSDVQPELRQWRLANSALIPSGDNRTYGVIEANKLGCQGARNQQTGLNQMGQVRYDLVLNNQNARPAYTLHHNGSSVQGVIDTTPAIFQSNGEVFGTTYQHYVPSASSNIAREIGLQTGGYFGARGVNGLTPDWRSFGANLNGDIIALPPRPSESIPIKEAAPNLVITGGNDGLVHIFRAFDGWELFAFIPQATWTLWNQTLRPSEVNADAYLNASYLSECRQINGGGRCIGTSSPDFRPVVVGSANLTQKEIFGFEIGFTPNQLRQPSPQLNSWPSAAKAWSVTANTTGADKLGLSVSRPALTHIRIDGKTRGVAILGCGDDQNNPNLALPNQVGRCLLFIDAFSGEVLHTLKGTDLNQFTFPVTGSPSVLPGGDIAAEQIYIGDRMGQMWRIDLIGDDPDEWVLTRIWPVALIEQVPEELTRGLGFKISERPSLALAPNNDRIILFGTSGSIASSIPANLEEASRGYMVSLRERKVVDELGHIKHKVSVNWVLDYAPNESLTGAPKVKDGVLYFTTIRSTSTEVCGQSATQEGRLYGVHYTKYLQQSFQDAFGNRSLNVVPMLPRYKDNGERADNALSVILPPGRTAHGFAVVSTPSCSMDTGTITELVMNLTNEGTGGQNLQLNGLQVEFVRGMGSQPDHPVEGQVNGGGIMTLEKTGLDQAMQVQMTGKVMNVALTPANGAPPQSVIFNPLSPFPSKVMYWGGAYGQ